MTDLADYVNKTVPFKFNGAELRFDLSHALFSSFDIDVGTRLLLKTAARDPVLASARRILDEGCGVGVIGLSAAKAFPEAEVLLRDRDGLAVAFTERNRLANKLRGTTAWTDPATGERRKERPAPRAERGLLGDGREGGPFDFVFSNLPAKAGAPVLAHFFDRLAGKRGDPLLVPGGRAAAVIVNPLAGDAAAWIEAAGLRTVATQRGGMHHVYVVERPPDAAPREAEPLGADVSVTGDAIELPPELRPYLRSRSRFKLASLVYSAAGFWGLPEFDTPSFGSSVAAELASRVCRSPAAAGVSFRDGLFIDPGVGHFAVWAVRELGLKRVTAVSRDELSLRAAAYNLASQPPRFAPTFSALDALSAVELPSGSFDFIAESPDIVPERDWVASSWEVAGRLLRSGGVYLAYCSPTEMTRLEKRRPAGGRWVMLDRRRKKGFVAAAWRKA